MTARGVPGTPTLALRAGGIRIWGRYPFFEAAFVGGRGSLRGFNSHRFLGDASLYGGAELRLALGSYTLVLPGRWGVFALGDAGRVYLEREASSRWHTAAGGGLWLAFLDRRSTLTFTLARSPERTRLYAQAGFHF